MHKTNNKKSKVDKCPSTFTQENKVKDVSKKCILNEHMPERHELKNGLVNGVVNDLSNVKKSSRRNKKIKHVDPDINGESIINEGNESIYKFEDNCLGKTATLSEKFKDQSNTNLKENSTTKSDNTVNNVDKQIKGTKKKKCKLGKLDSNENISTNVSCDNELSSKQQIFKESTNKDFMESSGLGTILQDDVMASCSNSPSIVTTAIHLDPEVSGTTVPSVLEVADSLKNIQLENENSIERPGFISKPKIDFIQYESELQMPMIMKIIQKDLSEPYSIYTYRYFIHNWPKLCFLAMCEGECVGAIVCKLDLHRKVIKRGYIAMLAVDQNYRKLRIGSNLVQMAINEMLLGDADEVVLETEVTNKPALQLYEKLGFVRDKRLFRYYLNGVDALRLKLWLR